MAVGSYGIVRPADVSPADVEILYHYVSDRTANVTPTLTKLDSTAILTPVYHNSDTGGVANKEILGGLYNLKLQAGQFSELGIYTLHLRPKQVRTTIMDCGVLASLPSVRGLILDLSNVKSEDRNKFTPQGLVGYRIEYINSSDNKKIPNFYRIITSSFFVDTVVSNPAAGNTNSVRYRYIDSPSARNLVFATVSPSSAPSNNPNAVPYIGQPGQQVILTNTFFNPTTVEIEMVEHDASTLAHALYGNQSKAVSNGIYTIYNKDNNIYKQFNLYEVKDEFNETLYEIREEKTDIDQTLNFDDITQ